MIQLSQYDYDDCSPENSVEFFPYENYCCKRDCIKNWLFIQVERFCIDFCKRWRRHLAVWAMFFFANNLFSLVHQTCPFEDEVDCLKKFLLLNLQIWIQLILFSTLTLFIIGQLALHKRIYIAYFFFSIIDAIHLGLFSDMTISVYKYFGGYSLLFCLFYILEWFLYFIIKGIISCFRKYKARCLYSLIIILVILSFLIIPWKNTSCKNWEKGIFISLDNSDQYCKLEKPLTCQYDMVKGWMDFSPSTCENLGSDLSQKQQGFLDNGEFRFQAYKKQFQLSAEQRQYGEKLQRAVIDESKYFNDLEKAFEESDQVLDLVGKKILLQVKRNESLAKERQKVRKQDQNVVLIFIDAISRMDLQRKLPLTAKYFKDQKNFVVNEFFRYHARVNYTQINMLDMYYGKNSPGKQEDEIIFDEFAKNGFVTGHSQNICQKLCIDLKPHDYVDLQVKEFQFDHEAIEMFCDPNYQNPSNPFGFTRGPYSIRRRCLYGKDTHDYVFEYGNLFWNSYQNENKFLLLEFIDAHEGTGEVITNIDQKLAQFLSNLSQKEKTTIILTSDHGLHMQGLFYLANLDIFFIEQNLPTLIVALPTSNPLQINYTKIQENQQNFVTSKDVFHTLGYLADQNNTLHNQQNLFINNLLPFNCTSEKGYFQKCVCH